MATPPEPLRLFDDGPALNGSQPETPSTVSRQETSENRTHHLADVCDLDRGAQALRAAADGAILVNDARQALNEAIDAARAAGHSWRTIGIATGIPYQTLHRNRHPPADRDARES